MFSLCGDESLLGVSLGLSKSPEGTILLKEVELIEKNSKREANQNCIMSFITVLHFSSSILHCFGQYHLLIPQTFQMN